MACNSDDGGSNDAEVHGRVALAGADGAAIEGLVFHFPNATIFGFPGESATLRVGDNAATFTLITSGGTVIDGTISLLAVSPMSCRLTQNPVEVGTGEEQFDEVYGTCEARIDSTGVIAFGNAGNGTVILNIARGGETPVASDPVPITLHLHEDQTATIDNNDTPI
jgi:hypothetical protein